MKDYDIVLLQGEHVTVVIPSTASEYEPYVLVGGVKYNPARSFKAVTAKKNAEPLDPAYLAEAQKLIAEAEIYWTPRRKKPRRL